MATNKGTSSQLTVAHFDRIADRYGGLYDQQTPVGYAFSVRRRRVLDLFDKPGGTVLDVGCGPGVMVEVLTSQGCAFWGVDPSIAMVEQARSNFASVHAAHFTVGVAERLHFPDESFDAIICMGVLERIADDMAALAEMARVLRPGGNLILTVPNLRSPMLSWRDHVFYSVVRVLRPLYFRLRRRPTGDVVRAHRRYGVRSLTASLNQHGCEVTDVRYCVYNPLPVPLDRLAPRLTRALMSRAEVLQSTPMRSLGAAFVIKARRR